jgi:hypothetical protein
MEPQGPLDSMEVLVLLVLLVQQEQLVLTVQQEQLDLTEVQEQLV